MSNKCLNINAIIKANTKKANREKMRGVFAGSAAGTAGGAAGAGVFKLYKKLSSN